MPFRCRLSSFFSGYFLEVSIICDILILKQVRVLCLDGVRGEDEQPCACLREYGLVR